MRWLRHAGARERKIRFVTEAGSNRRREDYLHIRRKDTLVRNAKERNARKCEDKRESGSGATRTACGSMCMCVCEEQYGMENKGGGKASRMNEMRVGWTESVPRRVREEDERAPEKLRENSWLNEKKRERGSEGERKRKDFADKRERALSRVEREGEREPAATAQLHPRRRSDLSRPRTLERWGRLCPVVKSYISSISPRCGAPGGCETRHTLRPLQLTPDLCDVSRRRRHGRLDPRLIDKGWVRPSSRKSRKGSIETPHRSFETSSVRSFVGVQRSKVGANVMLDLRTVDWTPFG